MTTPTVAPSPALRQRLLHALASAEHAAVTRSRRGGALRPLRKAALHTVARVTPLTVSARLFTGQRLWCTLPDLVAVQLWQTGFIEADVTRVMIEIIRTGDVVVDVGAQFGYHSLLASILVGDSGRVIAFEPARRTAVLLSRNTRTNSRIKVVRQALGAAGGRAVLRDFGPAKSALNTLFAEARVPLRERRALRAKTYPVAVSRLDTYCARHSLRPAFVKIDAEGSELAVLHGMQGLLTHSRPVVTLETGDYEASAHVPTRATIEHLTALGYRCLEYGDGLRDHTPRSAYGYGNLFFMPVERCPSPVAAPRSPVRGSRA